jgi:5-methylcytosine-specific restriction endonuclease McrA
METTKQQNKKAYLKAYKEKNKKHLAALAHKRYLRKKSEIKEYAKEYYKLNREKNLAKMAVYRKNNKAKCREAIDKWTEEHKEEYKAWRKEWTKEYAKKNRATIYARDVKRRELKQESIDETTDLSAIKQFYILAETLSLQTGVKYVVDHIYPIIKGGKHHQNNLQVITMIDNLKKGKKYPFKVENKHFPDEMYWNPSPDYATHT